MLHGLCTFGHAARALIQKVAGGEARRLKLLSAQLRKPVWPGDTIVTEGFDLGDGRWVLRSKAKGRTDPVLSSAWAQIR